MQQLNADYRGINRTTDVLSFPQASEKLEVRNKKFNKKITGILPTSHFLLGDIVINVQMAVSQAKKSGKNFSGRTPGPEGILLYLQVLQA